MQSINVHSIVNHVLVLLHLHVHHVLLIIIFNSMCGVANILLSMIHSMLYSVLCWFVWICLCSWWGLGSISLSISRSSWLVFSYGLRLARIELSGCRALILPLHALIVLLKHLEYSLYWYCLSSQYFMYWCWVCRRSLIILQPYSFVGKGSYSPSVWLG